MTQNHIDTITEAFDEIVDAAAKGCDGTTKEDFDKALAEVLSSAKAIQNELFKLE